MEPLRQIAQNKVLLESLRGYFEETLKEMIVERAYNRKDVQHIAEARQVIDRALIVLERKYESSKKESVHDSK